jgi:hypothetical protein
MLDSPTTVRDEPTRSVRALGFQRVEHVCLVVGTEPPVALVTGVLHRYPRTVRVSLATANRLVVSGVPLRIEHCGDVSLAGAGQVG